MTAHPGGDPGRAWVYTATVKGFYQKVHRWTGLALQAIFFAVPWLTVGGHPAVLVDLPARRVYAFGEVFSAQDTVFLVLISLASAFALFFFTALFGRLWCGYACPQTVWLEEWIRPLEKWIEGERGVRMHRDRGPWTFDKAWRKAAKWTVYAAISGAIAGTFVSWFSPARTLWTGGASAEAYGWVLGLGALMFWDFAWFREQFCNYLCPYARIQGALCDEESLVVAYLADAGEPRKQGGACIDCKKCVTVCPAGIDIREGFQLECITCGRCIDACTGVMGKLGHPSLIRYTSLKKTRWIRPRTVVYGALLSGVALAFVGLLATKHELRVNVNRAPGSLYVVDADGWTRNTFLLQVINEDLEPEDFTVAIDGLPAEGTFNVPALSLDAGEDTTVPLVVRLPPGTSSRTLPITVTVRSHDDQVAVPTTFKTPGA
ncbi:MAG: cytochrome c oxidase accessory protein CcoG [Myxococcota bacterium]